MADLWISLWWLGVLAAVPADGVFSPNNNTELRIAVRHWLEDKDAAFEHYGHISGWDVSSITNMSALFRAPVASPCHSSPGCSFNDDISSWDTSSVTDMSYMFFFAKSFNQPIGHWNTAKVQDMSCMFYFAESFNQPIGSWNTTRVKDMSRMFRAAWQFNQSIGSWNTAMVKDMSHMFYFANSFDQPLASWNTSMVEDMSYMFYFAKNFNQPIGSWDTARVQEMSAMFKGASIFNADLSGWSTCQVKSVWGMFHGACQFLACQRAASFASWCEDSLGSSHTFEDMFISSSGYCGHDSICELPLAAPPTTTPSTLSFCKINVEEAAEGCGRAEFDADPDICSDIFTASLAEEDSSLCGDGCKSAHSLEGTVGTLYNLSLASMIVIYIAFALMSLYGGCIYYSEKEYATIIFVMRALCQLTFLVLLVWAIVLSYSSAVNVPDMIMKGKCVSDDGIMELADLSRALDAISMLGPVELFIGFCGSVLDARFIHDVFLADKDVEVRLLVEVVAVIVVVVLEVILTSVAYFVFTAQANDRLSAVYTGLREGPTDRVAWCFTATFGECEEPAVANAAGSLSAAAVPVIICTALLLLHANVGHWRKEGD